jgi:hypothetical protein
MPRELLLSKKNKKKERWTNKFSLQMKMTTKNSLGKKDVSSPVSKGPLLSTELF